MFGGNTNMNFSQQPTTTSATPSFATLSTGLNFGVPATTGATASTGNKFSFGTANTPLGGSGLPGLGSFGVGGDAAKTGLSFGGVKPDGTSAFNLTTTTSAQTFSLGTTPTTSAPSLGGTPGTTASPGFLLGSTPFPGTGGPPIGSTFSLPTTTSAPTTGFSLGTPATTSAAAFSLPTATSTTGFSLPSATSTTGFSLPPATPSTGFSLPSATPATGFSLPSATSAPPLSAAPPTTSSTAFSLPSSTGFSLGAQTTSATPTFSLGASLGVSSATALSTPSSIAVSTSVIPSSTTTPKSSVNFVQLEESINKWTLELEEQERVFLNQVDQVRDWDRHLLSTGDKIVALNDGMQKVKLRQQQLNHELDFTVAQQRELEECLLPLEKEFAGINVSDPERDSVYQRAENLNTQLQQISEDLKSVIEHINERNRSQDTSDPIVQIGRILNAHMNSLQWVDQNTLVIQQMLDQLGKMREIHRRDADSTQNL